MAFVIVRRKKIMSHFLKNVAGRAEEDYLIERTLVLAEDSSTSDISIWCWPCRSSMRTFYYSTTALRKNVYEEHPPKTFGKMFLIDVFQKLWLS